MKKRFPIPPKIIKYYKLIQTIPYLYQLGINPEYSFRREDLEFIEKLKKVKGITIFKPIRFKSGFVGQNLTLEEYSSLGIDKKMYLESTLLENNMDWLNQKFQELDSAWITVVNGEIVTYSPDLSEYPQETDILKICKEKGKFPFIFVNNELLAIEESSSRWSKTNQQDDYYPTINIQLNSSNLTSKFIADFDTGTTEIFVDMDRLITKGLIKKPSSFEVIKRSTHLGKEYWYYIKPLRIGIVPEKGKIKKDENFPVFCICNWNEGPFVSINPNRSALVGRKIFLKIGASVILHFTNRKTEIY
ncbi:MAG: hypothetical protein AB1414_01405 [bacterium]